MYMTLEAVAELLFAIIREHAAERCARCGIRLDNHLMLTDRDHAFIAVEDLEALQ